MKSCALCAVLLLIPAIVFSDACRSADWPQGQGPDRNAISPETGLLQEWPAGGPPLAWRIDGLGGGDSAPAVADGKLFGMSNRGNKEVVWALSESDGEELWVTPLGDAVEQGVPQSREGPGCTPAVAGDRLYVIGMGGRVVCLTADDGEIVWERSLTEDFGGTLPMWSYRESPLVDGDNVICTPGGPETVMVALDKMSGETVWTSQVPGGSTPPAGGAPGRPERAGNNPDRGTGAAAPAITGTEDPQLFVSEHWGMTGFSQEVPNGEYVVNLCFAETYQGITEAGQRVFTFNVEGEEFADFDIFEKAEGPNRAYVESVPVEVTDGEIKIDFTAQVENPAIKAIEIIPQSEGAEDSETIRINAGSSEPFTDSDGHVWLADQGFEGGQVNAGNFGFGGQGGQGGQRAQGGQGGRPGGFGGGRGGFGGFVRSGAAYSSVIAIDHEGQRQYVQMTSTALIGVTAADGEFLWRFDRPANGMGLNCSTPIYQDGLVFASSAYGAGGGAVRLTTDDSGNVQAEEAYFNTRMQNHHGGMIVVDGALYGASGGNEGGMLACIDFQTGELLWRDRNAPKGSLAFADGRLYLRSEEDGTMLLVEPSKEEFLERGRFEQPDRSESMAWAHPVIANGKLYVRDQDLLLCYDVKIE